MNADRDHIDSALDALLRAHSTDMPSREVEGAILAAAHRAVQSTPRSAEAPRPWRRWMPLAAAATIAAITVGVLQLSPKSRDTTAAVVTDAPQVASEAPPATARADRVEEAPAANVQAQRAPALAKSSSADTQARTADQWIERIRALLREDKREEAGRELAAFRAAYADADASLPTDLRAWAATVKR